MREILFRGKRVDNNEWVYGYYFQGFTGTPYILVMHDHILKMTEFYEVNPTTVGQYVNLLDKNGEEIFESDIVIQENNIIFGKHFPGCVGIVGWMYSQLIVMACCPQGGTWSALTGRYYLLNDKKYREEDATDWEVIGNVYDNPELLIAEGGL